MNCPECWFVSTAKLCELTNSDGPVLAELVTKLRGVGFEEARPGAPFPGLEYKCARCRVVEAGEPCPEVRVVHVTLKSFFECPDCNSPVPHEHD